MHLMRFVAATIVVLGFILAGASAGAVPKPPPEFWSPARCERAMLNRALAPPQQVVCVGTGGPSACRWTTGHRVRLFSEFMVFMRHRYSAGEGLGPHNGVVRSFTLATRARPGFHRVVSHWGDQYAGWPADFFKRHVTRLANNATPAEFRSIVEPIAAHLTRHENATGCGR
jgi:hypothetical protein